MPWFALILLYWLALAGPAWAGEAEGVAAFDRGDYETAEREFRSLAQQGDGVAQSDLSATYDKGQGVLRDYAAVKWYRLAAQQGDAVAQSNLGVMYAYGRGVPKDYVQALKWLNLAAAHGNAVAAKNRNIVEERMTPADVSKAQHLAREWLAKHGKVD